MAENASLLMSLVMFEAVFVALYALYTLSSCSLGLSLMTLPIPDTSGIDGTLFGILAGFGKLIIYFINGLILLGRLVTGIGFNCGYPGWYVSIIQIPILITIIYLLIPFIKS